MDAPGSGTADDRPAEERVLEALQRVTDASLAGLSADALLAELLDRVTEILGTDTAAILLLDEEERVLRARAARGIEEEVERGVQIPVGGGFAGRIAAARTPIVIDDVDHADILNPILREKGIRSLLGVPLLLGDRILGVMHVGSLKPRRFRPDERDLLQLAADRAAVAIENANLAEQRRVTESLQRQLLRLDPDLVEGASELTIASRYLPASGESLGGDWYDAFVIGGGRVALAVGDVGGHGLQASAVMSQLRTALRAYAAEGHPPAGVVERVNNLMIELGPATMTTLAYVVFDPEPESIEIVVAGHPPPLMVPDGEEPFFLEVKPGIPLGAEAGAEYRSFEKPLESGTVLVLYTDGLVEVRGEMIDAGMERLREASAGAHNIEVLCDRVLNRLLGPTRADDVALVAARVPPVPERLDSTWPAEPSALAPIRGRLRRWLRAHGAEGAAIDDVVLACQEACANAIEHSGVRAPETFRLDASADAGRIRVEISDSGSWREPNGADTGRGRGIDLMRLLMESVEIEQGEDGTAVVLERSI